MKRLAPAVFASLLALLTGCTFTAPFRRPAAAARPAPDATVLVSVTAVEHRAGQRRAFFRDTKQVLATLPQQDGLVGYAFRFQLFGPKAWTITAWRDGEALDRFVRSPEHRAAVRNSAETTQAVKFHSFTVPAAQLPLRWKDALARLETAPGAPRSAKP